MRYLHRDHVTGKVMGHYANESPTATELVEDDHPDLLAFHAQREANKAASRATNKAIADEKEARLAVIEDRLTKLEAKIRSK